MGRRTVHWGETLIAERFALKHGQGVGSGYLGWSLLRDFSSIGVTERTPSARLDRMVLTPSKLARNLLLICESKLDFVDYWECRPLERQITTKIAKDLGVKHPCYFRSKIPLVMTFSGVLTTKAADGKLHRTGFFCGPDGAASKANVVKYCAILKEYCKQMGWSFKRFSEASYTAAVISNLTWLIDASQSGDEYSEQPFDLASAKAGLHCALRAVSQSEHSQLGVRDTCQAWERSSGHPHGTGLRCLRLLIAQHQVMFDLEQAHLAMLRGPVSALEFSNAAP